VTGQVQAMFAGDNYGFLIRDANENSGDAEQQYNSREQSQRRPELVVKYATAPSGAGGGAGGGAALAGAGLTVGAEQPVGPSVQVTLAGLPEAALDTHVVVTVSELFGPNGALAPQSARVRLNESVTATGAPYAPTATLTLPAGAPLGRYTGMITATWYDYASGSFQAQSFTVDVSNGGYRVHLPLLFR
jgi:hypothetical protein